MPNGVPTTIPFLEAAYAPRPRQPDTGSQSFFRAFERARQERIEAPLRAINQQVAQQALAKATLELELALQQQRDSIAARAAAPQLLKLVNQAMVVGNFKGIGHPSFLERQQEIADWLTTNSHIFNQPLIANQLKGFEEFKMEKLKHDAELAAIRARYESSATSRLPDPIEITRELTRLTDEAEAARLRGDTSRYQSLLQEANTLRAMSAKGQTIRTFGPTGEPVVEITSGGVQPGVTTATTTQIQKRLIGYDVAVEGITDVLSKLRPEDVGVAGFVGENLFDTWIEQVRPGTRSTERVENRTALKGIAEQLIEAVSADSSGRFSDQDVKRLGKILDSTQASKSFGEVQDRLGEVKRLLQERTRIYAERVGQPVPDFAKSKDEIVSESKLRMQVIDRDLRENKITQEQAIVAKRDAYNKAVSALRRYHGLR